MPKIVKKQIYWTPVSEPDAVGYRVYVAPEAAEFSYALPFVEVPAADTPEMTVDAPGDFPSGTFDADATYDIWITTIDDQGNESDPLALSAPFDFVAPPPPASGGVRDI